MGDIVTVSREDIHFRVQPKGPHNEAAKSSVLVSNRCIIDHADNDEGQDIVEQHHPYHIENYEQAQDSANDFANDVAHMFQFVVNQNKTFDQFFVDEYF